MKNSSFGSFFYLEIWLFFKPFIITRPSQKKKFGKHLEQQYTRLLSAKYVNLKGNILIDLNVYKVNELKLSSLYPHGQNN